MIFDSGKLDMVRKGRKNLWGLLGFWMRKFELMTISEKKNINRFLGSRMICSVQECIILLLGKT